MHRNKAKIMKILFIISFLPITAIIVISICYAIVGHAYYDWFEPEKISYIAYGAEEFFNSIIYYGGYLSLHIPILPICLLYQIYYFMIFKLKKDC